MSDLGNRIRTLFSGLGSPTDLSAIVDQPQSRFSMRVPQALAYARVGIAAAVVALILGGTALLLRMDSDGEVAEQITSSTSPTLTSTTAAAALATRWEWLVANSEPAGENLRIALASATPEPRFDYLALGSEQLMEIGEPDFGSVFGSLSSLVPANATIVYAGRHAASGAANYFFTGSTSGGILQEGGVVEETCVLTTQIGVDSQSLFAGISCWPATPDSGLIGGVVGDTSGPGAPTGTERFGYVSMQHLPIETAVAVLDSEQGEPILVRPILGMAVFQVPEAWLRGTLFAEALDADGQVIATDQVGAAPDELQSLRIDCSAELDAFPCAALVDGSAQTMWQAPNGGIDTQITLVFDQPIQIAYVGFTNTTDPEQFRRNAHIKDVEIKVDDLSRTWLGELTDTNDDTQWVDIETIQTSSLTITVTGAYPGVSYEDGPPFEELALGEIVVLGVPTPEDPSEIPQDVLDYWALDGTLDSVQGEPGWLCPQQGNAGYTSAVEPTDVPAELRLTIPGIDPQQLFYRDSGPQCQQPHFMVLLDNPAATESATSAGMTIWPRTTRLEDECPPENCSHEPPVTHLMIGGRPAEILSIEGTDELRAWWFAPSGTPMYAESSGLTEAQITPIISSIIVSLTSHTAILPETGGLVVVSDQTSEGIWVDGLSAYAEYEIDGTSVSISVTADETFDPTALFAHSTVLELVTVHEITAIWLPVYGRFLMYESAPGFRTMIEGALTKDQAIEIAESLESP